MSTPVSDTLTALLRHKITEHGLVVWLDTSGHYTTYVDTLARQRLAAEVIGFRGSYLRVMDALDGPLDGVDAPRLLLHLPGFNKQTVRDGPLLEVYKAGNVLEIALDAVIRSAAVGRVAPAEITRFLAGTVTLQDADDWLAAASIAATGAVSAAVAARSLAELLDELLAGGGALAELLTTAADLDRLWQHLARTTGITPAWRTEIGAKLATADAIVNVGISLAAWALAVELVDDLSHPPTLPLLAAMVDLDGALKAACLTLPEHLRATAPDSYVRLADELEGLLIDELTAGTADRLGSRDTFRIEEQRLFHAALDALDADQWPDVARWSQARLSGSFWVGRDAARRSAWRLVAGAAALGAAIAAAGRNLGTALDLTDATDRYVATGAAVDRAHRHLEQLRERLFDTRLPAFGELLARLNHLRGCYDTWLAEQARDFSRLCTEHGFLPPEALQQRRLFEQVLLPLLDDREKTAFFLVDAMRYELAGELAEALSQESRAAIHLTHRLAELPTETAVGMNALPPTHHDGRLTPVLSGKRFAGFATATSYQVRTPEQRQRMISERLSARTCPWLSLQEVLDRGVDRLKSTIGAAQLVLVSSLEIDAAGEHGGAVSAFDDALRKLRSACQLLREAGVRRFVFTADHGFLLTDGSTPPLRFGGPRTPTRRYTLTQENLRTPGTVSVALSKLGYNGEGYLLMPEDAREFDTGGSPGRFTHGGNSPQERIIPVLTVRFRRPPGGDLLRYTLAAAPLPPEAAMSRLTVRAELLAGQSASLGFGGSSHLDLALRVPGREDIAVELCEVQGGSIQGGALRLPVGADAVVCFKLKGAAEERVPLKITASSTDGSIEGVQLTSLFPVLARHVPTPDPEPPVAPPPLSDTPATPPPAVAPPAPKPPADKPSWTDNLPDDVTRRIFLHIVTHGAITEAEATGILGSPRSFRKFNRCFEDNASRVPFRTRVLQTPSGKRYEFVPG